MIFATQFADEISAVTEQGGEAALRERVGALDEGQRQVLRAALDCHGARRGLDGSIKQE